MTPAGESPRTPATIYDIARAAGVSPSTVSRALNKPGRISAATEKRIRDAAEELGYRLNPMARALHTGRTSTLGLILSDITNPVYFDLVRGAERVTAEHDFTLVLAESQESPEAEAATIDRLLPSVDGFVLVASRLSDETISRFQAQKPIALVNRVIEGVTSFVPSVAPGIRAALDHLHSLGHCTLAFVAGPATSWMSGERWRTICEEAVQRGMSVVEIAPGIPTLSGGEEALRRVVASGATAVLAYNDLMAIGLMMASQAKGVRVPERLSIVGFDDIFGASFTTPALTTIRSPLGETGGQAVRSLLSQLSGRGASAEQGLETALVVRGSTGAPTG